MVGSRTYCLLSAVNHCQHWATMHAGFRPKPGVPDQITVHGVKVKTFEKNLSPGNVAYLGSTALSAFTAAVTHHYRYFGWDTSEIMRLENAVLEKLKDPPH
jgi:hypothetical protein